jgi:putative phosphoesterase
MLIGLMSDSHDNFPGIRMALDAFSDRGIKLVLHAGDMIGSGNCYTFEGYGMDVKLVYGNNDGDRVGLAREFKRVGGEYLGDFGEIEADGLKIAMLHGTADSLVRAVVASGIYDVVVRGHNHRFEAAWAGETMLINPGEVWGLFTGRSSVAVLDTSRMVVETIELGRCKSIKEYLEAWQKERVLSR